MKSKIGIKLLYGASALMVLGFLIHLFVDYRRYSTTLNSAPFWVWGLTDALLWLIPAALAFAAGIVAQNKIGK